MSRRYREGKLVLETDFETADGMARVIDFMPPRDGGAPQLMRIVQGLRGRNCPVIGMRAAGFRSG